MNDNHLIEKQLRHLVPGQLIIFAKLDKYKSNSKNHLMVKTNGIIQWTSSVEAFLWNHLGKHKIWLLEQKMSLNIFSKLNELKTLKY